MRAPKRGAVPRGHASAEIDHFLDDLVARGRSPYTLRTYAQGLAHFARWLAAQGLDLEEVTRTTIASYIADFESSAKEGAVRVAGKVAGTTNPRTGKADPSQRRRPRTVNHRLSVLASFFAFLIERDGELGGRWAKRPNPVPQQSRRGRRVLAGGRDAPARGPRAELRRRVGAELPKGLDPELAEELIVAAPSARDKAILSLLLGSGQRIGDWPEEEQRHGVLGLALRDLDETTGLVTVRLKGDRREHRVPVGADFWPLWRRYLRTERPAESPTEAAWVGFRRGGGRPLRYRAFERALRTLGERLGANVHAHMLRHTLAQLLVAGSGLAVAQRQLGHRNPSSTTVYAQPDEAALIDAVAELERGRERRAAPFAGGLAFDYAPDVLGELERLARGRRNGHPDL